MPGPAALSAERLSAVCSIRSTLPFLRPHPASVPAPEPPTAWYDLNLRLAAYAESGVCARVTVPFAPSHRVQHLHRQCAVGESMAAVGALGCPGLSLDTASAPAAASAQSLALRDGVPAAAQGAVDELGGSSLLQPLGLLGSSSAQQPSPLAALGAAVAAAEGGSSSSSSYRPPQPAQALAAYDSAGQRAASAEGLAQPHAWPSGQQHAYQALRLGVLPQEPEQPPARAGYTRESLVLLASLKAFQCEGTLMEQHRLRTSAGLFAA